MARGDDLTGVWHGLYSYPAFRDPVYFVATLIQSGTHLSGATHEQERGETGAALALFAMVEGGREGSQIGFVKQYDGAGGWEHAVLYQGMLDAGGDEIEGQWLIPGEMAGKFLMMRSPGATESVARKAFSKV
jgi:hypothetical protein